jgi:divalent metal cation (Fe/Co/Zn/Cd) transporter
MLDGAEPGITTELRHAADRAIGVIRVDAVRARWLGHRLHAEMTLAVDPSLSVAEAGTVMKDIREYARHHLPALESLHIEVVPASDGGGIENRPKAEHKHHH